MRYDRAATVDYYYTLTQGGADRCGCSFCRNFVLQRSTCFPAEFLDLVERLGIDAAKEHEVYELGATSTGLRLYQGWFCFVGEFLGTEAATRAKFDSNRFSFGFSDSFPWIGPPSRESIAAVAFSMPLPWLLPDENPD